MEITRFPAEESDFEFSFEAKRQALGPYVQAHWGWEDNWQREMHRKRWVERPWSIIVFAQQRVGTVSVAPMATHVQFGEFYLLPQFQRRGIGTEVLRAVLCQADADGLPVKLEFLKGNPVGSLYERHGFTVVAENDHHYFLVRAPRKRGRPGPWTRPCPREKPPTGARVPGGGKLGQISPAYPHNT